MDNTSGYDAFPAIPLTSNVSTARETNSELLSTTVTSFFSEDKCRAICQPTCPAPHIITFI